MQHSKASFEGLFVHVFLDLPVNLPYSFFVAVFSLVRLGTELSTLHVLRRHSPIGLHSLPLIPFHHVAESSNSYAEIELSQDLACSEHVGLHLRPQSSGIRTKLCYRVSVCARKWGGEPRHPAFLGIQREIKIDVLVSRSLPRPATLWEAGFLCPVPFSSDQHP